MAELSITPQIIRSFQSILKDIVKECKKKKELREECLRADRELQLVLQQYSSAVSVSIQRDTISNSIYLMLIMYKSDTSSKLLDKICLQIEEIYSQSDLFYNIKASEMQLTQQKKSITQYLLEKTMQIIDELQTRFYRQANKIFKAMIIYSNDIHLQDQKNLQLALMKIAMSSTENYEAQRLLFLNIQVLSQKYYITDENKNLFMELQDPQNEETQLLPTLYYNDYKLYLMDIGNYLELINMLLNHQISGEQFKQKLRIIDYNLINWPENLTSLIMENIYWLLTFIPVDAIYDQKLFKYFKKLYLEMVDYVILTSKWALQESFLTLIEIFLETFLPVLDNQFIFEHFNNFVIRIINCEEIPHYQLKSALIVHLVRLLCADQNPELIEKTRLNDKQQYQKTYQLVDLINMNKCTEKQHKQYFELIQRSCFPPGAWIQYLFVNFDCQFTQPNLVMSIFDSLKKTYQFIQQQSPQSKQNATSYDMLKEIWMTRRYAGKANKIIQEVKSCVIETDSEMSYNLSDFSHSCGLLWNERAETINKGFESLSTERFKVSNYPDSVVLGIARIMAELYRSYLIYQYQQEEKCGFNYGIPLKNIEETEQTLKQKLLMQIGYDKFNNKDSSPLKAISHFEEIGYLTPLKKRQENEDIVLNEKMMEYYNQYIEQQKIEQQNQEQNVPKKRVKRNFEQEYDWNMQQIAGFLAQYTNCSTYYYEVIEFYLKYRKQSEFSVGLDKAGFGELIGGSKLENKAFLYYYTQYYITNYLEQVQGDQISFVQALRTYLETFKLPGEGQVIDRILSFFSKACSNYIGIDHRTTHGLSFAVIMLNTDLHNQSIKDARMTKNVFISNTKRIDLENQLTDEYLGLIYDEIYANPFTLNEIESIKKYFTIIAKYIKIDDKKEQPDPSGQQQEKTPEDDKETEFLKQLAPVQRYSKAILEWIHYKSTYYNTSNIEGLLEKQSMMFSFNSSLFAQLFKLIDQIQCLSIVANCVKHKMSGNIPIFLHCMKVVLLVVLNKELDLNDIACKYLKNYINVSHFLKCHIIQFDRFQEQRLTLAVIDGDFNDKQKKAQQQDYYIMRNQQLEIIQFIMEIVKQKLNKQKPEICYSGELFLGDAWKIIMPVMSRIQYFAFLLQKIPSNQRSRFNSTPFAQKSPEEVVEFRKVLLQEAEDAWTRHGIPPMVQQNLVNIITVFKQNVFQMVQDFQNHIGTQQMDEFPWLLQGLSETSQIEIQISILPDYCLFSENIMTAIYLFLLYSNKPMFVECYCSTFNHYEKILIDKKGEIAVRGFSNASKIMSVFINQQMQSQQSKNDKPQRNDSSENDVNLIKIWDVIFQPLQYCLLSENVQLLFNLINRIEEQLKSMKINEEQFRKLKDIVKEQQKISDQKDIKEFITIYNASLEGVKFPKTSFIQLLQIFNKSINIFLQKSLQSIMKAGMNVDSQSLYQKLSPEYKSIMENIYKITKNLEGIVILQMFTIPDTHECQVNNNETQLISVLISISSQLIKQDIWRDYSLNTQESHIKFINLVITLVFKTSNFTKYEQNDGNNAIIRLYNLVADMIVTMCNDNRPTQFLNARQQVQKMLCYLLHNKAGMNEMKKFMEILLCQYFINDFQNSTKFLMNSCKNIENNQFICEDFEHKDQHCLTEMVVQQIFIESNEYTIDIQRSVFKKYLNVYCEMKSSSIYNILLYMVQHLIEQKHEQFVLETLQAQLKNIDKIKYGSNFLMVLSDVLKYGVNTQIYDKILIFASNTYCTLQQMQKKDQDAISKMDENKSGYESSADGQFTQKETKEIIYADTYKWLKIIYRQVLKQFLESSLHHNLNLIETIVKLIVFFADEKQTLDKPTQITLGFLQDLDEKLYEQHFKVPLYPSLLKLIEESNDRDIRVEICKILKTRYPANTVTPSNKYVVDSFKASSKTPKSVNSQLPEQDYNMSKEDIIESVSNFMESSEVLAARQHNQQQLNESVEFHETTHQSKSQEIDEIEKVDCQEGHCIIGASETDLNNIPIINTYNQIESTTDQHYELTKSINELGENDNTEVI